MGFPSTRTPSTRRRFVAASTAVVLCGTVLARVRAERAAKPTALEQQAAEALEQHQPDRSSPAYKVGRPDNEREHADFFRQPEKAFVALEAASGGRLGVAALDTGTGRTIGHRVDERFAMCSTHKLLTAAAILAMVDQGQIKLGTLVPFTTADLLDYAPVTRKNIDAGLMTVDALCQAVLQWSDNTAENLLLGRIGGPAGWTGFVRSIGDTTSRLDRSEPALNTAIPGDPRDTTTPRAMLRDLDVVLIGTALSSTSRSRLRNWLLNGRITDSLLRAGLPEGWRVGDKSGSGERGTRNDVGIILPPARAPILAAVFYTETNLQAAARDRVIADAGAIIARTLTA
jgi:beta-lactamase class A